MTPELIKLYAWMDEQFACNTECQQAMAVIAPIFLSTNDAAEAIKLYLKEQQNK